MSRNKIKTELPPLSQFKERESKEDIIGLIGNLPTMRLILAWPNITIRIVEPENKSGISLMGERKLLWVGVEIDYDEIAAVARIPRCVVESHVTEAQMYLWIYPDGTVNKYAKELANVTIVKLGNLHRRERSSDAGHQSRGS